MSTAELTTVEIEPQIPARATVIWMHGLGADGNDFKPIIPELRLPPELGIRFVFPNAPMRAVTINDGMLMRAWYDIFSVDLPRGEDAAGIRDSERLIQGLIRREKERGIPLAKILLAGFSQGGAMALHTGLRYPEKLAGILALSCYLPLADTLAGERYPANRNIPLFITHGSMDPVIPVHYGRASVDHLKALGYQSEWKEYNMMGHEVCWEEIRDIAGWLQRVYEN